MPENDAIAPIAYVKGMRTDVTGDTALSVPLAAIGWAALRVVAYNSKGNQSAARIGVFTGPAASGVTLRGSFALSSLTDQAQVASIAAASPSTVAPATTVYINVDTASGVAGTEVDVAIYGYALP